MRNQNERDSKLKISSMTRSRIGPGLHDTAWQLCPGMEHRDDLPRVATCENLRIGASQNILARFIEGTVGTLGVLGSWMNLMKLDFGPK